MNQHNTFNGRASLSGFTAKDRVYAMVYAAIWTSTALNDYLDFPFVGQVLAIQRRSIDKKTGKETHEMAYCLTSHTTVTTNGGQIVQFNRSIKAISKDSMGFKHQKSGA